MSMSVNVSESVKYKFAKKVNYSKCLMSATLPSPDLRDSEAKVEFVLET